MTKVWLNQKFIWLKSFKTDYTQTSCTYKTFYWMYEWWKPWILLNENIPFFLLTQITFEILKHTFDFTEIYLLYTKIWLKLNEF